MTSAEIRAKIKLYEKEIDDYTSKIKQLEDDQEEFNVLIAKISSLQSDFESHQAKRKNVLSKFSGTSNLKCISQYCDEMNGLLNSVEYIKADEGLAEAIEKIQKSQRKTDKEIDKYNASIISCRNSISRLELQLQLAMTAESTI